MFIEDICHVLCVEGAGWGGGGAQRVHVHMEVSPAEEKVGAVLMGWGAVLMGWGGGGL